MAFLFRMVSFFYPVFCLGCGVSGSWICAKCLQGIKTVSHQVCPITYKYSYQGKVLQKKRNFFLDALIVSAPYNGNKYLIRLIKRLKYIFAFDIAPILGEILKNTLQEEGINITQYTIVPVPLHWTRFWYRGFNQSELLAKSLGKPCLLLRRIRSTKVQAQLPKEQRGENVLGAFESNTRYHVPKKVLLVDDVSSTLSTMNECAKVLKKAGVEEVLGLVLARNT